ncbi:MAG: inositol-3-phosphate synthase, partial [Planctomycetota bacterium]
MSEERKTGVWIVGALGAVSTCVVTGAEGLRQGLIDRTGMVTARPEFEGLGLCDPGDFVFGGWDIRGGSLAREAEEFAKANNVLRHNLRSAANEALEAATARLRPGITLGGGEGVKRLTRLASDRDKLPLRGIVESLRGDLRAFRERNSLDTVVVVHLAS